MKVFSFRFTLQVLAISYFAENTLIFHLCDAIDESTDTQGHESMMGRDLESHSGEFRFEGELFQVGHDVHPSLLKVE